ncbi:MAG: valine--tRNA ligase [Cytophagaceae bacterium]
MTVKENKYNPREAEDKWYNFWNEKGFFSAQPNPSKEPYTVVIPPPNVTGVLHMGHMLNNTIQDVLIRKARMQGKEACWVPGTDHASIATEAKVVAMLREKGIKKSEIGREQFLEHAWEWKEKYGGIILSQLKKLGASCDWNRTRFTMEPSLSKAVIKVFIDLHQKGFIYKGVRMVNWDPQGKTALSDEEVIHKEVNSKLYYIKYKVEGEDKYITVATTRPETILGDTAVCVNPKDKRYQNLKGKRVLIPLLNKSIPVILDEYVDLEFGTGCLKVTPCHDVNDYNLGVKHNLEMVDILNEDGSLSEKATMYVGEDRFIVRKKIAKDLQEAGLLEKVEDIKNNVGYSERTDAVIEPRLSAQWFVDMKKFMAANPEVLDAVMNDDIVLYPAKFKNTYRHWLDNIKDWCISRQLWWGHRIPAWYHSDGSYVVAETSIEAVKEFKAIGKTVSEAELRQDEDVLDTWFSSWLWPISVFDGFDNPDNPEVKYFYPTEVLVTAPEILFFWVARMIMAGYEYRKEKPFKNVYLTGIVRDKEGRKMSKSLGNSPDPLDLIDKYGADGVRVGMLFSSPAGNDLLFDEKLCEQGRNFSNKIWNAYRLISGWNVDTTLDFPNEIAVEWIKSRINHSLTEIEDHFTKFRLSDGLMAIYKLIWDDFCSWYLEMIKPGFEQPIDVRTYKETLSIFESLLKILHPFMPFITEELWHEIGERNEEDCIMVSSWPEIGLINTGVLSEMEQVLEIIGGIRNVRNTRQIAKNLKLDLYYKSSDGKWLQSYYSVIGKLAAISAVSQVENGPEGSASFVVKADEFFIPLEEGIDIEKEKERLAKELEYTRGFLKSVEKKLSNEKFVNNAPKQVLDGELKKKADAEAKLKALEESLSKIK